MYMECLNQILGSFTLEHQIIVHTEVNTQRLFPGMLHTLIC